MLTAKAYMPVRLKQREERRRIAQKLQRGYLMFRSWKQQQLLQLCRLLNVFTVPEEVELCREGAPAESLFFVLRGTVDLRCEASTEYRSRWPKAGTKNQFEEEVETISEEIKFEQSDQALSSGRRSFSRTPTPMATIRHYRRRLRAARQKRDRRKFGGTSRSSLRVSLQRLRSFMKRILLS